MKTRFPASALRGLTKSLDDQVGDFLREHEDWRGHMARVQSEPETHQGFPAPEPSALVSHAIAWGDGNVPFENFEIYDDTPPQPTPEQVARDLRQSIMEKIFYAEQQASEAAYPSAKRRHNAYVANDAAAKQEGNRTDHDRRILRDEESRLKQLDAIARHAAQVQYDFADLPDEKLEGYEIPEFPK